MLVNSHPDDSTAHGEKDTETQKEGRGFLSSTVDDILVLQTIVTAQMLSLRGQGPMKRTYIHHQYKYYHRSVQARSHRGWGWGFKPPSTFLQDDSWDLRKSDEILFPLGVRTAYQDGIRHHTAEHSCTKRNTNYLALTTDV